MTEISKSVFDPRNVALVLFGIGGTVVVTGILSLDLAVIFTGLFILQLGALILFKTRPTFQVIYDNKAQNFTLSNKKETVLIHKNQVIDVYKRFTPLQLIWPFPRPFYYVLSSENKTGKPEKHGFIIWSSEKVLLRNYTMMKRSVDSWTN